jgi:hypothetical protein
MDRHDPLPGRLTRRRALQLIAGAALALPAAFDPRAAGAIRTWCRTDPVVALTSPDGRKGNDAAIYLSAALEDYELNDSSCDIVIEHPKDAKTDKLWEDPNGYFGQGVSTNFRVNEALRCRRRAMEVRVLAYVPASREGMKIRLEWAPGPVKWDANGDPRPRPVLATATGYGNEWIVLRSELPYR